MIKTLIAVILSVCVFSAHAQSKSENEYTEIGKKSPDIILNDVSFYSQRRINVNDFKGKWVILDFWNRWCGSCIASFPKINQLRKRFAGKVEIISVGEDDKYIRNLYEKFRVKYNLEFPVAYDSVLFKRFGISSVPYIIWIDPNGIVRAITYYVEAEDIQSFLDGKDLNLPMHPAVREKLNEKTPTAIKSLNGKEQDHNEPIFSSSLSKWRVGDPIYNAQYFAPINKINEIDATGGVGSIYRNAYFDELPTPSENQPNSYGKVWFWPILEIHDTLAFNYNAKTGESIYWYKLLVPLEKANNKYMQKIMQQDLHNYFGYNATMETRKMPYWKIVAINELRNKLQTKGGTTAIEGDGFTGMKLMNQPIKALIPILHGLYPGGPPFVDETSITSNIDLNLDAILSDFNELKEALHKNGLDLVKGEKEMKVLVIRDPA